MASLTIRSPSKSSSSLSSSSSSLFTRGSLSPKNFAFNLSSPRVCASNSLPILHFVRKSLGTWAWNWDRSNINRFADGEIYVQLQESVRGFDVYIVQPTCPPANENRMELLIMIDACRRASAKTITAVIPYFGYARADRKASSIESIAAKLVANLITEAGANRVLVCDLHSGQSMVVSPDVGRVARERAFAKKKLSDAPLAIVDKRRHAHNVAEVMNLTGDVKGKIAVMVDDMIDTAGTIAKGAAALLHQEGAREVYACCTHAVFSPPAIEKLSGGLFQEVIITNILLVAEKNYFPQPTVLSVANLLGETIWRVRDDCSVSSIFSDKSRSVFFKFMQII
ncbi:Ribose-phosphate pyrophosphokinase 2 [Hibiscus syriacus]|uniref:ribose-phosphate diphosphokinase n=1 Tax=Hibiscus syriacus TaxID=106335 RepID=A0A6A2YKA7_HIBSY|nr:Ribose-phosphate pyrophosphokinase 2 [Hibiscus syriacus]